MRINSRWLAGLLVAVMLISSFCVPAMAAGESLISLEAPTAGYVGDVITIGVNANEADVVADGKLTVTYDASVLTYIRTEVEADGWKDGSDVTWSVNAASGEVIIAFASVYGSNAGRIFNLVFEATAANGGLKTVAALDPDNSYISDSESAELEAEVQMQITVEGGTPNPPVKPEVPVIPDYDDVTDCDGGADCPSDKFVDVDYTGDFHYGIDFVVENGIMGGISETEFAPTMTTNRAMMVTILYRLEGEPAVTGENPFVDVKESDYFYNAVIWAVKNGITNGISETEFAPKNLLTREQIATFLYRYAKYAGYNVSASASLDGYTDASSVSAYAVPAMQWAVGSGIVNGTSATTLSPKAGAQRVQLAVMVWRLVR